MQPSQLMATNVMVFKICSHLNQVVATTVFIIMSSALLPIILVASFSEYNVGAVLYSCCSIYVYVLQCV